MASSGELWVTILSALPWLVAAAGIPAWIGIVLTSKPVYGGIPGLAGLFVAVGTVLLAVFGSLVGQSGTFHPYMLVPAFLGDLATALHCAAPLLIFTYLKRGGLMWGRYRPSLVAYVVARAVVVPVLVLQLGVVPSLGWLALVFMMWLDEEGTRSHRWMIGTLTWAGGLAGLSNALVLDETGTPILAAHLGPGVLLDMTLFVLGVCETWFVLGPGPQRIVGVGMGLLPAVIHGGLVLRYQIPLPVSEARLPGWYVQPALLEAGDGISRPACVELWTANSGRQLIEYSPPCSGDEWGLGRGNRTIVHVDPSLSSLDVQERVRVRGAGPLTLHVGIASRGPWSQTPRVLVGSKCVGALRQSADGWRLRGAPVDLHQLGSANNGDTLCVFPLLIVPIGDVAHLADTLWSSNRINVTLGDPINGG